MNMKELMINYPKNQTYIIAVSGGPDSMALLNMLYKLGYHLVICHVNYHKRKESNYEQEEIEKYSKERNIPLHVLDTKNMECEGNFQAWAREIRYQFFKKQYDAYKASGLFVAHHQDDLLETYLMQKKRHGIVSYYGIRRETQIFNMRVLRPLLDYKKGELLSYCVKNQLFYSIDSSNLEDHYTRNKIRHHVIKDMNDQERHQLIDEINKQNQELEEHYLKANELLAKDVKLVSDFEKLDELSQNIFLYLYITSFLPLISNKLSFSRIMEIKKILSSTKPNVRILLLPNYYFIKSYDRFMISDCINKYDYEYIVDKPMYLETKEFIIDLTKDTSPLNIYSYSYPLKIRNVRKGDVVKIGNLKKKVNRILIDEKISLEERKKYPVVLDCNNNIVYLPLNRSEVQKKIAKKLKFVIK